MDKVRKRDRDADGGTERGRGQSQPRMGRGVFYTYAVLTVWLSGVFVTAGLSVLAYAMVSLWLFGAAYAAGPSPSVVAGDEIGKMTVIAAAPTGADGAAVAFLDCLRRLRWQPQARREECGMSKTDAQDEIMAAVGPASVPIGGEVGGTTVAVDKVTGADGAVVVSLDGPGRYRWQPYWRRQERGMSTSAARYGAMIALDSAPELTGDEDGGTTVAVDKLIGSDIDPVAFLDCLYRYRWQPQLRREECAMLMTGAQDDFVAAAGPASVPAGDDDHDDNGPDDDTGDDDTGDDDTADDDTGDDDTADDDTGDDDTADDDDNTPSGADDDTADDDTADDDTADDDDDDNSNRSGLGDGTNPGTGQQDGNNQGTENPHN